MVILLSDLVIAISTKMPLDSSFPLILDQPVSPFHIILSFLYYWARSMLLSFLFNFVKTNHVELLYLLITISFCYNGSKVHCFLFFMFNTIYMEFGRIISECHDVSCKPNNIYCKIQWRHFFFLQCVNLTIVFLNISICGFSDHIQFAVLLCYI